MKLNKLLSFLKHMPKRFKIIYGGRGGSKSWDVAGNLLLIGLERPVRILACREVQKSLAESVHALFDGLIRDNGLEGFYKIRENKILGSNGTEIHFAGLRNAGSLKSYEAFDYVWIEEGATLSYHTWSILEPTIRKEGSEIWITFNPDLDTDFVYKEFVLRKDPDAISFKINYTDNPFCPSTTIRSAEKLKERDIDAYNHIYLGFCKQTVDGAVYANEIREATTSGRITKVPYTTGSPVHTFWDLGYADFTAIWFVQYVGMAIHVIDYHQMRLEDIDYYLGVISKKPYLYGKMYLPHDAKNKLQAAKGLSISDQIKAGGYAVDVLQAAESKIIQLNAVRSVFPKCYFDEEKCSDGLNALRRYRYKVDPNNPDKWSKEPEHDVYSHGADAFAQMAIRLKPTRERRGPVKYDTSLSL